MIRTDDKITMQLKGAIPLAALMFLDNFFSPALSRNTAIVVGLLLLLSSAIKGYRDRGVKEPFTLLVAVALLLQSWGVYSPLTQNAQLLLCVILLYLPYLLLRRVLKGTAPNLTYSNYEFRYITPIWLTSFSIYIALTLLLPPLTTSGAFIHYWLSPIVLLLLALYEKIRISMLNREMNKSKMLPIINEALEVVGVIEQEESLESGNTFLHPHLRCIIVCNNSIYLQKSLNRQLLSDGLVDTPLSSDLYWNEGLQEGVQRMVQQEISAGKEIEQRHLLNTIYQNPHYKRFVALYLLKIPNETMVRNSDVSRGKFWSFKQIEESLGSGLLSQHFENEFELITALMVSDNK